MSMDRPKTGKKNGYLERSKKKKSLSMISFRPVGCKDNVFKPPEFQVVIF